MTIDETEIMLNEIAETIPEALFRDLNGGVCLLPEVRRSPVPGAEELFVLGEYCHNCMGRYVNLYYGSFLALHEGDPVRIWRRELRKTLLHELTHHMESLAGVRDLEVRDEEELEDYLAETEEWEDGDWDEEEWDEEDWESVDCGEGGPEQTDGQAGQ